MRDPWLISNLDMLLRLLLSVLLGGLIGFERERKNHAAGLRTHILVCLGSCLIMILSIYGFAEFVNEPNVRLDPARLAAQVITGIGFLGAGTIVITGRSITGLTTAASVWVVMAIGLSVGAGFYMPAVYAAVLVLFTLWLLNIVEKRYFHTRVEASLMLVLGPEWPALETLQHVLSDRGVKIVKVQLSSSPEDEAKESAAERKVKLRVSLTKIDQLLAVTDYLRHMKGIVSVSVE